MIDHTDGESDRRTREAAIYRAIGAQLRAVWLACGVSQEELAERLGIEACYNALRQSENPP